MSNSTLLNSYGSSQTQGNFIILNKDMIKTFGLLKAGFIAIIADLQNLANIKGFARFYATLDILTERTGLSDKTIKKYFKELKELKIIDEGIKGEGLDSRKYYKFDFKRLGELVFSVVNDEGKNTLSAGGKNTLSAGGKNTPMGNDEKKATQVPNNRDLKGVEKKNGVSIIYNNNNNDKNKNNKTKNLKKDFLLFAEKLFNERLNEIQHFGLKNWLEWVSYKIERSPKMTNATLTKNLNQLISFNEFAIQSIEKSISAGYAGLFNTNKGESYLKPKYDPKKGNTGKSLFSDKPSDYIDESKDYVTKTADGFYKVDMFKAREDN